MSRLWRIIRTALRCSFTPLPRNVMSAISVTSPDIFFHTNWNASLSDHMFSPLPAIV